MKNKIINLLKSTKRAGIDALIERMEESGFFTAPCSTQHHLAKECGLAEHSLNVYNIMNSFAKTTNAGIAEDTIIICAILHDLGKIGDFGKANYVPNYVRSKTKNKETGEYDMVISEAKPYASNPDLKYEAHEIRSIKLASKYIDLTEDEEWAILMHNGLYGDFKYTIPNKETPIYMLLHFADMWASRVIEVESEGE